MTLRAFTLIEVLVVMVIISILLMGSIFLTVKYSRDLQWNRLFNRLEQHFLDVNTSALAGLSSRFAEGQEAEDLPDLYHLYFRKGEAETWYFESRPVRTEDNASSGHDRMIIYPGYRDLDVSPILLDQIVIHDLEEGGSRQTEEAVLMTWRRPFAQLGFYPDASLIYGAGEWGKTFALGDEASVCVSKDNCFLDLKFRRSATESHGVTFDLQKGIYRDFY